MSTMRVLICLLGLAVSVHGQSDVRYLPTDTGRIRPWVFHASPSNRRDSKATPAELKAVEASVRGLERLITPLPVLNPPKGFEAFIEGTLMAPDAVQAKARPGLPLDVWVSFGALQYYVHDVSTGIAGATPPKRYVAEESNHLDFFINDVRPVILDHIGARKWEDAEGDFYLEPAATGQVGGFPMYKDVLVIARPGESIWAPVSVDRFIKTLSVELKYGAEAGEKRRTQAKQELEEFLSPPAKQKRQQELDAARTRSDSANEIRRLQTFFAEDEAAIRSKVNPDPVKDEPWYSGPVNAYQAVMKLQAELDAAGRSAPACVIGGERVERWKMKIVPAGTPGCHRVVQANTGLFKAGLPRSAIQLITVEGIQYCREVQAEFAGKPQGPGDCVANLEVARELDWQKVAALLEK